MKKQKKKNNKEEKKKKKKETEDDKKGRKKKKEERRRRRKMKTQLGIQSWKEGDPNPSINNIYKFNRSPGKTLYNETV